MNLPTKGPNSPYSVGNRTLLARTCKSCGQLVDGDSFPILNAGTHKQARRWVCHKCFNARKKQDREERGIGVPEPRPPEELQTRRRTQWSVEDDMLLTGLLAAGTSYEDTAVVLGRSLLAVYKRRDVLGISKVRKSHRVEKPWSITPQSD